MRRIHPFVVAAVALVVMTLATGVKPAIAQAQEARGTVSAVTDNALTVKAGSRELSFVVDSATHLEVREAAQKIQAAQPGAPSPRVNDFFRVGETVLVRYRVEKGSNHALNVERVGSAGAGGGSISQPDRIAEGKVKSVTQGQLIIDSGGHDMAFAVTGNTDVLVRGASKATKTAGGSTPITTFVHAGDAVSVSFKDDSGVMTALQVRVRIVNR